jgi:alpha-beta hydrolase superfamily lysophospholipase
MKARHGKARKRVLVVLAGAMLAVGVGVNGVAAWQAYTLLHFDEGITRTAPPEKLNLRQRLRVLVTGVRLPRPRAHATPRALDMPYEDIQLPAPAGETLAAWYIPTTSASRMVLLFHGYAAEKSSLLEEARQFHQLGYGVVLVDFRGVGESSGSGTTLGFREAEDVRASVNWVRAQLRPDRLILYGQSMGAAALLRAVAHGQVEPDGIMVESVFDTLTQTVRNRFHAMKLPATPLADLLVRWGGWLTGYPASQLRPVDDIKAVRCPVLVMHGADDPRVRQAEARAVFEAAAAPKVWQSFEGAGHEALVAHSPDLWRETVGRFCRAEIESAGP